MTIFFSLKWWQASTSLESLSTRRRFLHFNYAFMISLQSLSIKIYCLDIVLERSHQQIHIGSVFRSRWDIFSLEEAVKNWNMHHKKVNSNIKIQDTAIRCSILIFKSCILRKFSKISAQPFILSLRCQSYYFFLNFFFCFDLFFISCHFSLRRPKTNQS